MAEKVIFESNGLKLSGVLVEPSEDKKIVIVVHGYSSNKNRTTARTLTAELTKHGINSFRFDLQGCGESEGDFADQTVTSSIDNIKAAVDFVKQKGYTGINLFGGSAGGLYVMAAALSLDVDKIALKAPVTDYPTQRLRKHGQKYLDDWKKKGYAIYVSGDGRKLRINYKVHEDTSKFVMYDKVKNIKCPVLIIHGTEDKSVDINQSRKVIKNFPNGKLIEIEGGDHGLYVNGDNSKSNKIFAEWFL